MEKTKSGIVTAIPGAKTLVIDAVVSDYTGTASCDGRVTLETRRLIAVLSSSVGGRFYFLTSDTTGTARAQLEGLPVQLQILKGDRHDLQKVEFMAKIGVSPENLAFFGNGTNDAEAMRWVKEHGGLGIAVSTGEGVAVETLLAATIFAASAEEAYGFLANPNRTKAGLRH